MLIDGRLVKDQLIEKLIEASDKMENQYFFTFDERPWPDFDNLGNTKVYASVKTTAGGTKEIIGFLTYRYDVSVRRVYGVGAINFTNDRLTFGRDIRTLLHRLFIGQSANMIEFRTVFDNPAQRQYRRFVAKLNGVEAGQLHEVYMGADGRVHDMSIYEIHRSGYVSSLKDGHFSNMQMKLVDEGPGIKNCLDVANVTSARFYQDALDVDLLQKTAIYEYGRYFTPKVVEFKKPVNLSIVRKMMTTEGYHTAVMYDKTLDKHIAIHF